MKFCPLKVGIISVIGSILLGVSSVHAQSGDPSQRAEIEFSVYASQSSGLSRIHYMSPEQTPVEVKFLQSARSKLYPYVGPKTITFFDYVGTVGEKDFRMMPKATAQIPEGAKQLLFFFLPNPEGSQMPFRVFVFDDSEKAFPYQSAVVFNLSGRTLLMNQGSSLVRVNPGPMRPLGLRNGVGRFEFYYEVNGRRYQALNEIYRCRPDERIIIILLPPILEKSAVVRTRVIRDTKPKEEEVTDPKQRKPLNATGGK